MNEQIQHAQLQCNIARAQAVESDEVNDKNLYPKSVIPETVGLRSDKKNHVNKPT
jgi:hypothetical protein